MGVFFLFFFFKFNFFRDIERLKVLFLLSLTEGRVCDSDGEIRDVLVSKGTFYLGCYDVLNIVIVLLPNMESGGQERITE